MPLLEARKPYKPVELKKFARVVLLALGGATAAFQLPVLFEMTVPAPGFEWVKLPVVTTCSLMLILGANTLSTRDKDASERRLDVAAFGFATLVTVYLAIKHIAGV